MEKIQTHVLAYFRETYVQLHQASNRADRHWQSLISLCLHISCVTRSLLSHWLAMVWLSNCQNTANSTVLLKALMTMMVSVVTVVTEFQPATPEPRTTTSLGANDLVVTGHAHSVPHSSRRDTGRNDGFTAWQIRIRSLDRRCGCWPLFRSNCTDASTRTPWVKYTLAREKNFCLAEKWSG